jgi:hypothetical protein
MSSASFSDVQSLVNQIQNDNTAQNNAISAQIGEVSTLLTDYAARAQQGNPPNASDLQQVVSQLRSVDSLIQSNTANVQASANQVASADPNAAANQQSTGSQQSFIPSQSGPATQAATGQTTTS